MNYQYKYQKYKHKYHQLKRYQTAGQTTELNTEELNTEEPIVKNNNILIDANNKFTIGLFENFDGASNLFSPIGIQFAISLVHLAAVGNTDMQLTKLLNYKYSVDDLKYLYQLFNNKKIIKMVNA